MHSWYQNDYDDRAFKRPCNEFGVQPKTDWRQKLDHGCQGLGSYSQYMEPSGAYRQAHRASGSHTIDAIRHKRDISRAWTTFILEKGQGFTQVGVVRLNDSIRTFVWAILGSQAQTRSNVLKIGTGFDAQKQFLAIVEDAIASPIDIPFEHRPLSDNVQYAPTPLDYVLGIELYLAPSDMTLHTGNVQGYNNEIVTAGSDAAIGHNPGINESEPISGTKGDKAFQGKLAPPARTVNRGPAVPSVAPVTSGAAVLLWFLLFLLLRNNKKEKKQP